MLTTINHPSALREQVSRWRQAGKSIGFVPTMGALHTGHLALVEAAHQQCDHVIVSIFVNPLQFGANEDLDRYPRTLEADSALLEQANASILYAPSPQTMYPQGFSTTVRVSNISEGLCGAARPGHFDGVATVVTKLLLQTLPDRAFFGEKDYQQLCVIRRVVQDLDMPTQIVGVPTVREADGLALSSRNRYLSATERAIAPKLYQTLQDTAKELHDHAPVELALQHASQRLLDSGFRAIDYLELRDAHNLAPLSCLQSPARLLVAAKLGTTRLIDNIAL